jgi:hypothetical protein
MLRVFHSMTRLPSVVVMASLFLCGFCAAPALVEAREQLSAGEYGDPGDGTGLTSTSGVSLGSPPPPAIVGASRNTGSTYEKAAMAQVLLIPVPIPPGMDLILVVSSPAPCRRQPMVPLRISR